jgi:hypothetical protein
MVDRFGRRSGSGSRVWLMFALATVLAGCSAAGGGASSPAGSAAGGGASPAAGGGTPAGGGAVGAAVAAGDDLCKLLGPGDFANAGVPGAAGLTENNQPPSAYYCVYRGKSSATGGIELDLGLEATAADAQTGFPQWFAEFDPSNDTPVSIAGADQAALSLPPTEGSSEPALIGVRKGRLTFVIGVGTPFANAHQVGEQLKTLAGLVMQRATALGG